MPKSKGRPPGRGRSKPHGSRGRRPGPPISVAADALRRAERHPWGSLLDDECWASGVFGAALAEAKLGDRDVEATVVNDIVARAAQHPTGATRALLEALRRVGPAATHAALDTAIADLADLPAPAWVGTEWRVKAAATVSDPWDDDRVHLIVYDAPVPHSLLVSESRCLGSWVDTLGVSDADMIAEWGPQLHSEMVMELRERPVADVARDMARALHMTGMTWPPQTDDNYLEFVALVRARVDGLGAAEVKGSDWEPISGEARQQLIADFLASIGMDVADDDSVLVADCLVDYSDGYLGGDDPLAWSPIVPGLFLDWMQRKVILDMSARARVPELLPAWVRFALTRRGVAEEHIELAVHAARAELEDVVEDDWGVAEEIGAQLLAQGVDLTDPDAVQAGMRLVNAQRLAMATVAGAYDLPPDDLAAIRDWVDARVPERVQHQVRWELDLDRNRVTIVERRAPWQGEGDWVRREIVQLRYSGGVWSLYWQRLGGRWDPYPEHEPSADVEAALDAIDDNVHGCFD